MRSKMCADGLYTYEESQFDDGEGKGLESPIDSRRLPALATRARAARTASASSLPTAWREKQTVIPAAAFHANTRDICASLSELGLYIDRERAEALLDHLQKQMLHAESADLAISPGWITPTVFVLPEAIFGEQENGRAVYYGGAGEHSYRTRGTVPQWRRNVAQPCQGNSRLILAVSSGFAGPLMADAGEQSGGFHLHGPTSRGKSTALIAGGSVCGGGDQRTGFVSSWRTTANGLEPLLRIAMTARCSWM